MRANDGVNDPEAEAEGELALARLALDGDDLTHAAGHLAGAYGQCPPDPTLAAAHAVLADLHARVGGGLADLFPLDDGPAFIGTVVGRAYALARNGDAALALGMFLSASGHEPHRPWARGGWVTDEDFVGRLDPDELASAMFRFCGRIGEPTDEPTRRALRPYLELMRVAVRLNARHGRLAGTASTLARRLGEIGDAVALAERAVHLQPEMLTEIWLGNALRASGRYDDALVAMHRALDHDPQNLPLHADIANILGQLGRHAEAIATLETAVDVDPDYDCVMHTLSRLRFVRDRDVAHLVALADFVRTHESDGACRHSDLEDACADVPWLGFVPGPAEACTKVLDRFAGREVSGARMALSDLEVPSALTVVRQAIPGVELVVEAVRAPDIREPVRAGTTMLWRFSGIEAEPAVEAPTPEVAMRVARIASVALPSPVAAYDRAVSLAGLPLHELLGCLVHPPVDPRPEGPGQRTALWVRTVQVAACLGMLHHRTDEAWDTSRRRAALVDIAYGQEDWTVEAALFALAAQAWTAPETRPDVAQLVSDRFLVATRTHRSRVVTILPSLASIVLATPEMPTAVRGLAGDIVRDSAAEAPDPDGTDPATVRRLRATLARTRRTEAPAPRRWFGRRRG